MARRVGFNAERNICNICHFPGSTNDKVVWTQEISNGKKKMVKSPCPKCNPDGSFIPERKKCY